MNDDNALETLCHIALKSNIQDKAYNDSLYWILNEVRGYTYEYYVILLTTLYIQTNCATANKLNKKSNGKMFIQPVYEIMTLLYRHIKELKPAETLNPMAIENFSKLYQGEIKQALLRFTKTMLPNSFG